MLHELLHEFETKRNQEKAAIYQRFFKTGSGEYSEGDFFMGLTVPEQRLLARKYINLTFNNIKILLESKFHEYRLTALLILTYKFAKATEQEKSEIVQFYCNNRHRINNWDLVDSSAAQILGTYLVKHSEEKKILYTYAKSQNLWDRRIAIISTFAFIKKSQFEDTLNLSTILLKDKHDLIHKAVGWMLREIGKKDEATLKTYLNNYAPKMPRTTLRYAIERFDQKTRKSYLALQ